MAYINLHVSLSPVCAGGGQQGNEALSTSVFGNAGMFPGGDRGDRPGASEEVSLSFSFSLSLFSLTLSAYLRETTIGFCTPEQDEEASDGSRV